MLSQVVYQTNADYVDSYEAMAKNGLVVVETTEKGLLWFRFVENQTVFLLSPKGKLQVKWRDVSEKKTLFRLVRKLLVAKSGEKLWIKPVKQQTWINYPVPGKFKLYWCDEKDEYVLKTSSTGKRAICDGARTKSKRDRELVKRALEELRLEFRFLREPTLKEVALKSGCSRTRFLKRELQANDWIPLTPKQFEASAESLIELAAWIRIKQRGGPNCRLMSLANKQIENAQMYDIERSQRILKDFPEMIPEANGQDLVWSEEAKRIWRLVFCSATPAEQRLQSQIESDEAFRSFFGDNSVPKTLKPFEWDIERNSSLSEGENAKKREF